MKKIELKDILNYNYLSSFQTNPSETQALFVKSKARYDENDYLQTLYSFDGTHTKRLFDLKSSPNVVWETDSTFLFQNTQSSTDEQDVAKRKTVYYRYHLESGEIESAFTFKIPVSGLTYINENYLLLSTRLSESDHQLLDDDKREAYLSKREQETYYEAIDTVPFYFNGSGFTQAKQGAVYLYNTKDQSYTALFKETDDIALAYYDDKQSIAYFYRNQKSEIPEFYSDIYAYDFNDNTLSVLYDQREYKLARLFVLNDAVYVFANDGKAYGINQNSDIYRIKDGTLEFVAKFGLSANNSIGSDVRYGMSKSTLITDSDYYFVGTYRDRSPIYRFNGTNHEVFFDAQGSIDGLVQLNGHLYAIGLFNNKLQEIYKLSNTLEQCTRFNDAFLEDTYVAIPQHIPYENDGQILDGWVLLPENYDENKTYPAILDIHGGPKTIYSDVFYHEMQAWVNDGYIVFFTNPRGGDAYDDAFADIRGKYGSIDYEDIMAFTDLVLERYAVDPNRMGVTGGSYGGFMTNWIVSHTDRFKAAATQRSISNWVSFYGTSDIGSYFGTDQTASDIYENIEAMWSQSPLKYAKDIKTPLLFIHSDEDYRCPIEQAMQLFTAVKMNGIETRFIWIKGENHDLSRSGKPKARVKRLEEITQWMNRHLK